MSGTKSQASAVPAGGGVDPSMEDILASIRRILSEEDLPPGSTEASPGNALDHGHQHPDVLILDESMLVADPAATVRETPPVTHEAPPPDLDLDGLFSPDAEPDRHETVEEPAPAHAVHHDETPELDTIRLAQPMRPEAETFAEEEPFQVPPAVHLPEPAPVHVASELAEPFAEQPAHSAGEPVETEPPMPSSAMPALTAIESVQLPPPAVQYRLPPSPVLVPVPSSGHSMPPPLIRRPASVMTRDPALVVIPRPAPDLRPAPPPDPEPEHIAPAQTTPQSESPPMSASMSVSDGLASVETATAAAGSVTNLVRALTSDRHTQVHSGGPTIADLVREEIRPLLKEWLDNNLPPLVERLVRAEIDRVISRASV